MSLSEKTFVALQYVLPQHLLSRIMGRLTHCQNKTFKNFFIRAIVRLYGIDVKEAENEDLNSYRCFNDFFTRSLKPDARSISTQAHAVVSPADGAISQAGPIKSGRIIQAKGRDYSALELLGGDTTRAQAFDSGSFATIYLSPKDYHRLHMPLDGKLLEMIHIPGDLFSVNDATCRGVPNLFARNERVVALFETEVGPMALVLVGAIFVASIETLWHGVVTPPTRKEVQFWDYRSQSIQLTKGDEMGRFNMGSTIVVLFGQNAIEWMKDLSPGKPTRLGEVIGILSHR